MQKSAFSGLRQDPLSLSLSPSAVLDPNAFSQVAAAELLVLDAWASVLIGISSTHLPSHRASGQTQKHIPAWLLPLCLLAPGGLGMATGNAEFPTLFFVLGLTLSVLTWDNWWLTIAFAAPGDVGQAKRPLHGAYPFSLYCSGPTSQR